MREIPLQFGPQADGAAGGASDGKKEPFKLIRLLENAPILDETTARGKYLSRELRKQESSAADEQQKAERPSGTEKDGTDKDAVPDETMENQEKEQEEETEMPDQRMQDFLELSEDLKDKMTCDEVFCMYLREVSKQVNETYYK